MLTHATLCDETLGYARWGNSKSDDKDADKHTSHRTVMSMRALAAAVVLEQIGVTHAVQVDGEIDGLEMCASLCWAITIAAEVGAHGSTTIQSCAGQGCDRAVALVTAMLDGSDDLAEAAVDTAVGANTRELAIELLKLARLVGARVERRDLLSGAFSSVF